MYWMFLCIVYYIKQNKTDVPQENWVKIVILKSQCKAQGIIRIIFVCL